jgi:putative transposase
VKAHQAVLPVTRLCGILGLSCSGFYAWLGREPSARAKTDERLRERVRAVHEASSGTYGAPRIHAELAAEGTKVGRKRVARLMRDENLEGETRRRGFKTTVRGRDRHGIPDLVERDFTADAPNQLWVADITYVPTRAGFIFLAVVLDVFSRRIVGWSMADDMPTELVLAALEMALQQRKPEGVVHHSDQGCQYTSIAFGKRCKDAGVRISTGSVGDCYDNAMAESFFATLECELIERNAFHTKAAAKMAVFRFIEGWYNPHRRHSSIGYLSPADFEADVEIIHSQTSTFQQVTSLPPDPPRIPPPSSVAGSKPAVMSTTR